MTVKNIAYVKVTYTNNYCFIWCIYCVDLFQKLLIDEKSYYLFGRNKDVCDFVLEHQSVSRVHAALVYHKHLDRPFLVDLGSSKYHTSLYLHSILMNLCTTVYVVYLAVVLIWQFGKSHKYHQIKCTLPY